MLPKNVLAKFSVEESDFLPASGQSDYFCACLIHSLVENSVTLLNDFCTSSIKKSENQMFNSKIWNSQ